MTTSYVGSAFAEATSVTLPTHQSGDLIIIMATRWASTTVPTVPSGWSVLFSRNTSNRTVIIACKIASSSSETSGTWTNAEMLACGVWRDDTNYLVPGAIASAAQTGGTTMAYPLLDAVNTIRQRSSSWVAGFGGVALNSINGQDAPTGMTNRGSLAGASTGEVAIHDSNGNTTWSSTVNVTLSSATSSQSTTIELWDTGIAKSAGSSAKPYHPLFQNVIG